MLLPVIGAVDVGADDTDDEVVAVVLVAPHDAATSSSATSAFTSRRLATMLHHRPRRPRAPGSIVPLIERLGSPGFVDELPVPFTVCPTDGPRRPIQQSAQGVVDDTASEVAGGLAEAFTHAIFKKVAEAETQRADFDREGQLVEARLWCPTPPTARPTYTV